MMQTRIFEPAEMSTAVIMTDANLLGPAPVTTQSPVIWAPSFVL